MHEYSRGLVLGMTLKGLDKLFVIFSVDIWLWLPIAITYILRISIFFYRVGFSWPWLEKTLVRCHC